MNLEDKNYLKEVGERIKKQRKIMNMNQTEFGMHAQQFYRYEKGDIAMTILTLKSICEKLECTSDYLLGLPNNMNGLTDEQEVNLHLLKQLNKKNNLYITGMLMVLLDKQKADEEKE